MELPSLAELSPAFGIVRGWHLWPGSGQNPAMRQLVLVVAIAAAVLLAACGGEPASAPPTIGVQADLGKLLVADAPPGFTAVADPARTGPIRIEDIVSLEGPTGLDGANLAAFGFLDGYQRSFAGPTPDETMYLTVEQYTSVDGARRRFEDASTRADSIAGRTAFEVPAIPDAHGSTFTGEAEGLADARLYQVLFPFENLVVRVERASTAASAVGPQDVIAAADAQYRLLRDDAPT